MMALVVVAISPPVRRLRIDWFTREVLNFNMVLNSITHKMLVLERVYFNHEFRTFPSLQTTPKAAASFLSSFNITMVMPHSD